MTLRILSIIFWATLTSFALVLPGNAKDFGEAKDVAQVRKIVAAKFGQVLNVSVSHEWALCTAYSDESDLSVVLRRSGAGWKIAAHDGGTYDAETLKSLGVAPTDIPSLLKTYQ